MHLHSSGNVLVDTVSNGGSGRHFCFRGFRMNGPLTNFIRILDDCRMTEYSSSFTECSMSWKETTSKRALRRHHKQRMIQHALRSQCMKNVSSIHRSEVARKWADHLKVCSCVYSCGNIRHNPWSSMKVRFTRQEKHSILTMTEQLFEVHSHIND